MRGKEKSIEIKTTNGWHLLGTFGRDITIYYQVNGSWVRAELKSFNSVMFKGRTSDFKAMVKELENFEENKDGYYRGWKYEEWEWDDVVREIVEKYLERCDEK